MRGYSVNRVQDEKPFESISQEVKGVQKEIMSDGTGDTIDQSTYKGVRPKFGSVLEIIRVCDSLDKSNDGFCDLFDRDRDPVLGLWVSICGTDWGTDVCMDPSGRERELRTTLLMTFAIESS